MTEAAGAAGRRQQRPAGAERGRRPPALGGDPTTVVLARHGRTEHTEARLLSGGGSDPGLSPAGVQDARWLAAAVAALGSGHSPIPSVPAVTRVQVSPQRRARETLAEVIGQIDLDTETEVLDGWREISFGDWEGMAMAELFARHPDQVAALFEAQDVAPPGGESVLQLRSRVAEQVAATVAAHPSEVVLVVTHGGPVASAVNHALDAGIGSLWRVMVEPCSLTVLRFWPDRGVQVVTVNAVGHLAGARPESEPADPQPSDGVVPQ